MNTLSGLGMIRCDKDGVPMQVQKWSYQRGMTFQVELCNGKTWMLDIGTVRDHSCRGYTRWDNAADQMAIDKFVDDHRARFFKVPEVRGL